MVEPRSLHVRHASLNRIIGLQSLRRADDNCEPPDPVNNVTARLNNLLEESGEGYVLHLCPGETYLIQAPIAFAHPNQEISTLGYPTGDDRATLSVSGPVSNRQGQTTAVDGTCNTCSGITLRNIQIDGARRGAPAISQGGGNIEMGGNNANQTIEYVRSYDPRGWTCLHVAEGSLACDNVVVHNNDIGPCGSDQFQQWADGVSMSCQNGIVRNNMIQGPTDGGIVVFQSPGTQVYNNTIWILNQTLLGGINMVDYGPWKGNYTGMVVYNNTILGGFANEDLNNGSKGVNSGDAVIKIGIAIGPQTWFGTKYGSDVCRNGTVNDNRLSGAFSYGIAITSAENFTVQGNSFFDNSSFIGARGPNCTKADIVPSPGPFIIEASTTQSMSVQSNFVNISEGESLICVLPPNGGDFWPIGFNPSNVTSPSATSTSGHTAAIAAGVIIGLLACGISAWLIRKWILSRRELSSSTKPSGRYTQGIY